MISAAVRHFYIHSGSNTGRKIYACTPITHYQPLIPPLFSKDICQQFIIFTGRHSIQIVITCHDSCRFCTFYCFLKCAQIDFMQSTFINHGITRHPMSFLTISGKMLQGCPHPIYLHCTNICYCQFSGEKRIFRIILKISATQRRAFYIDPRS